MFNAIKFNASRWHRTAVLGVLFFAAVMVLLPISAGAQCKKWDASGYLEFYQRGQSNVNRINLQQKGRVITGTASFVEPRNSDVVEGTVDGTIDGNSFSVQIFWSNHKIGVYNAKVLPSGRLDGEAYEKSTHQSRTIWHSAGVLKCMPSTAKPGMFPKPEPFNNSDKAKSKPPPPPKPPFIIASQAVIPNPYNPFGIVPLSWDGGPDHPDVEVWLSMDNGAETPAFSIELSAQAPVWKQPKNSIALQLQRYHHYRFVLKAAGKTLSTAAIVVP